MIFPGSDLEVKRVLWVVVHKLFEESPLLGFIILSIAFVLPLDENQVLKWVLRR